RRNLPVALLIGMAVVVTFYVLIQTVCIGTLPELATSTRPLADAASKFAGTSGAALITLGVVLSLSGNLNILILTSSRMIYAIADKGELPSQLAFIHPRYLTPIVSIGFTVTVMLTLTLTGTFLALLTLSTISRLVTYFATCGALPLLRRRESAPPA